MSSWGEPLSSMLDINQFREAMTKAADQHARSYVDTISMSIRWQGDDTGSERDTENFQSILKAFGFHKATELVIPKSDPTPGFFVRPQFDNILVEAKSKAGRTLVLFHYAGHGSDVHGELHFIGPKGRTMSASKFLFEEVSEQQSLLGCHDQVDVVFFLDCCYGHLTTRSTTVLGRVVEVLAAVDSNDPLAFAANGRATFTSKMANEIAFRKGRGDKDVEFAELITSLRKRKKILKKPTSSLRVGVNSIRLKFPGFSVSKSSDLAEHHTLHAVFKFSISKSVPTGELANFVRWIRLLPADIGLEIEDVYETGSVCLILRSSFAFFSQLRGISGVQLICETENPSQLSKVLAAVDQTSVSLHQHRRLSLPSDKENVPFRYSKT